MTRFRITLAVLGLTLLLAAACGDDDGGATPSSTAEPSVDGSASPTADASASPTDDAGNGTASPTPEPSDTNAAIELTEFSVLPGRTSARPGTVTFQVSNIGEIAHEFLVIRTDVGHANLPRRADGLGADESQLDVVGRIDPIEPGEEDEVTVDVESGTYVLICNLVSDSTSHYLSGMYNRFTVSNEAAPPDATTE